MSEMCYMSCLGHTITIELCEIAWLFTENMPSYAVSI